MPKLVTWLLAGIFAWVAALSGIALMGFLLRTMIENTISAVVGA